MEKLVQVRKENHIAFLTMNRPEKLNALSTELIAALIHALQEAEADPHVKAIILSGAGKSFCAGGDISAFQEMTDVAAKIKWMKEATRLEQTIQELDKLVISAVHGYAAGAGFSIALASDLIVSTKDALFALSFKNVGLIPDLGLMKNLVKNVPVHLAKEWILSGATISAEEAYLRGLVNRIAEGDLLDEAKRFAQFVVEGPPLVQQLVKYTLNHVNELTNQTNFMQEVMMQALLLQTEDHQEGVHAFFEKRKPEFAGR